jgi:Fe-S cluster assembly ATPase SufC
LAEGVELNHEQIQKLIHAEKGKKILMMLSDEPPATAVITLASLLATCISSTCKDVKESHFTIDEMCRMMKIMTERVHQDLDANDITASFK